METSINKQEKCVVIRDPKVLNREGCRFFIEADNAEKTLISSTLLRWLTHENDGDTYYTNEQKEATEKIVAAQVRDDMVPPFSMNILLYSDPRKLKEKDCKYIKALLQCVGVDVRYFKAQKEHRLRIALKGNKLFLSMSGNQINEVHEGIIYEATNENSPLLNYFRNLFRQDFDNAKRLKLVNNKIVFADNWIKRFFKWCSTETGMISIISGLIAIIASIIIEIIF